MPRNNRNIIAQYGTGTPAQQVATALGPQAPAGPPAAASPRPAHQAQQGGPRPPAPPRPPGPAVPPGRPGSNDARRPPGPPAPTYQNALDAQFGGGNPYGQRSWYGDNPLETAQRLAQRGLDQNLASVRARYGASGLGNSGREALAEGEALGSYGAQLGDILAQRGEGAFQADKGMGLQALMGAAGNQLSRDQLAFQMNQALTQAGTGITGIGAQEQQIPGVDAILGLLTPFANMTGVGSNRSSGASGWAFK